MEELIQEEIFDETDRYVELHKRITINMPVLGNSRSQSPETATFASELASPTSPYRSTPPSPNIMISTLLKSPINSPYRQSPFLRPTLYASPPAQPPSVLSPESNERYYYLSPSRVLKKPYTKLSRSNGS
ncbi:DUF21 domain-containing protein [Cardamine amara subsp. amara]|uniref:DUF21 domain-containing protein n=1 Tax=Cardamine amara subsp. amara TaxID=228776 RepID=A0ABD1AIX8_CARAN